MNDDQSKNQPAVKLRDGTLSVTIWEQKGTKGPFYTVQLKRGYQDENGNWKDSDSFKRNDLLKASRLLHLAYDRIAELHQAAGAEASEEETD